MLYLESIHGNSVIHSWDAIAMNGPVTRCNEIFASNYRWFRFAKFGWLRQNRLRYLK